MKILLLGEYSNVHWTLAEGLRRLGHEVTVVSNGDFWKDYPRDFSLVRHEGRMGRYQYILRLASLLPRMKGYDIVQVINPMFLELKAERIFPVYRFLRRHNRRVVMGAFGMDYFWVHTCDSETSPFRYSDFNIGPARRHNADAEKERADWLGTKKQQLNELIATDCDAIVAGLYEYWKCYEPAFPKKTTFIPFPINMEKCTLRAPLHSVGEPVRIFIGISRNRSEYKGTDVMLRAAERLKADFPDEVVLTVAEGLPFAEYCERMNNSHLILDQLYSYTPAMNALQAMSQGIICVGGGEPENYSILGENELRPIVNVQPTEESVYAELRTLVEHPERIAQMQRESIAYVKRHHDYVDVARRYEAVYRGVLGER